MDMNAQLEIFKERTATLEQAINRIAIATLTGTDEVDKQIAAAMDVVDIPVPSPLDGD